MEGGGKTRDYATLGGNGRIIPEGGEGIRYVHDKKIRLRPGFYHVVFGLPDENYYTLLPMPGTNV